MDLEDSSKFVKYEVSMLILYRFTKKLTLAEVYLLASVVDLIHSVYLQVYVMQCLCCLNVKYKVTVKVKVKAFHTRYQALGRELIQVYSQSACR